MPATPGGVEPPVARSATLELATRIEAKKVLFVHLEEYWNRGYDDYRNMESDYISFAYDGMTIDV